MAIHDDTLISKLDLPAKVRLLTGGNVFNLAAEPRIGLHERRLSDGPTGVRGLKFSGGRQVALFPNATLLSAAWSEESAYEVGRMLAEEALAPQIHLVLGPTINLHPTPLGGRLFEAYSDGPWGDALVEAVSRGEVEEAVVDDHLRRILRQADRVGVLGQERTHPADLPAPDSAMRRELPTRLAASGITVLTKSPTAPEPGHCPWPAGRGSRSSAGTRSRRSTWAAARPRSTRPTRSVWPRGCRHSSKAG